MQLSSLWKPFKPAWMISVDTCAEDSLRLVGKRRIVERAAGIAIGGGDALAQRLAAGGHLDFGRKSRGEEFEQVSSATISTLPAKASAAVSVHRIGAFDVVEPLAVDTRRARSGTRR